MGLSTLNRDRIKDLECKEPRLLASEVHPKFIPCVNVKIILDPSHITDYEPIQN